MTAAPQRSRRRAPRLGARDRIAPYITRRGRFRAVDPLRGRRTGRWPRIVGALGWAVLTAESLRRATRRHREQAGAQGSGDEPVSPPRR